MKKTFDRIITVMFENQYRSYVIQNPFLKKLAAAGADMTNYFGVFHPSQTNYLASFAGEICGVTNDTPPEHALPQTTLVDRLEEKGVSWKAYMEAYPNESWNPAWKKPQATDQPIAQFPPASGAELSRYYRKHNAFASYYSIQRDKGRWSKIVSDTEFWKDVANKSLPEYSWFTPDIWNDGHYLYNTHIDTNPRTQLVPQLSTWLEHVFFGNISTSDIQGGSETGLTALGLNLDINLLLTDPKKAWKQSNVPKGTLIVVTFDEADFDAKGYDTSYDGPNQIYTVLLGDMIEPGTVIDTPYNHYSLIRTVQQNFGLGSLKKNDEGANWFRFLWKENFGWGNAVNTGHTSGSELAVTHGSRGVHVVYSQKAKSTARFQETFLGTKGWSKPKEVPQFDGMSAISMASIDKNTLLVGVGAHGELMQSRFDSKTGKWSKLNSLGLHTKGSIALAAYRDVASETHQYMLCWVGGDGFIQSMIGTESGFSGNVQPVHQLTDGPMAISQLGASLFLVYKERNTRNMRITSYNTAPFNAFEAVDFQGNPAPQNNTTLHQWTAADYAVGHFSKKMAATANKYQNLGHLCMATADGEMHLVHRGGYSDKNNPYTELFGLTGVYSAENQLTNGYGTLDQAGWTLEKEMLDVSIAPTSPIAMCSDGEVLTLVWSELKTSKLHFKQATYSKA